MTIRKVDQFIVMADLCQVGFCDTETMPYNVNHVDFTMTSIDKFLSLIIYISGKIKDLFVIPDSDIGMYNCTCHFRFLI